MSPRVAQARDLAAAGCIRFAYATRPAQRGLERLLLRAAWKLVTPAQFTIRERV